MSANMNALPEHRLLTTTEAAKRACVSRPTISRAIKSGEISARYDNAARWMIDPDALDAWVAKRGIKPSPVHHEQTLFVNMNSDVQRLEHACEQLRRELSEARERAAKLEGEVGGLRDRISDAHAEQGRLLELLKVRLEPGPSRWSRFWRR